MSSRGNVIAGYIVPGKPHPLLAPKKSPAWGATRGAFDRVR